MKHVYSDNKEIAHLWFHEAQGNARNPQGNFYYQGDTIYSYGSHFPIARLCQNRKGEKAVLFTTRKYRNTTAKHIGIVWSAIRRWDKDFVTGDGPYDRGTWVDAGRKIFSVYNPALRFESTNKQWRKEDLDKTMRGWNGRIKDALDNVITPRIRKETKARNYASAVELITEGNEFCTFFGIRKRWSLPTSMEGLAGELQEAKKRADAKEQRQIAKNTRDRIARGHTLRQEYARALPMWLDGKIPKLPPNPDVELTAYLRIVPKIAYETFTAETEREVETSQGARFPLSHAVRALRLIRGLQQSAERRLLNESRESAFADPLFVRNGHSIKLGYYQIDRIESDGTIKAGCHVVSGAEFERFALVVKEYMRSLPPAESAADPEFCECGRNPQDCTTFEDSEAEHGDRS